MKLSFLGMKKLMAWASNDIKGDLKDLEFEQKDFKGSVLLTVEEAKAVLECVEACTFEGEFVGFVSNNKLLRDKLAKRIEQAGVNHAKGDI